MKRSSLTVHRPSSEERRGHTHTHTKKRVSKTSAKRQHNPNNTDTTPFFRKEEESDSSFRKEKSLPKKRKEVPSFRKEVLLFEKKTSLGLC